MRPGEVRWADGGDSSSDIGFFLLAALIVLVLYVYAKIKRRKKSAGELVNEGIGIALISQWVIFSCVFIGGVSYVVGLAICKALSLNNDWAGILAFFSVVFYLSKTYSDFKNQKEAETKTPTDRRR